MAKRTVTVEEYRCNNPKCDTIVLAHKNEPPEGYGGRVVGIDAGGAKVTVNDERVITRITENRDAHDRPEGHPEWEESSAYRNTLYHISTRQEVLEMLVWNAAANGVRNANRLDGWADLADDAAVVDIESVQVEWVDE